MLTNKFNYRKIATADVFEAAAINFMAKTSHAIADGWQPSEDGAVFHGSIPIYRERQFNAITALMRNVDKTATVHGAPKKKRGSR